MADDETVRLELLEVHPLAGARLVETCVACPTQNDVHLPDGRKLYFRYRFARWQLHLDGPSGHSVQGSWPDRSGEDMDGMLSLGEVIDLLEVAVPTLLNHLTAIARG